MSNEFWQQDPAVNPFDAALALEGVTGDKAALARRIYAQESNSGANTATSNRGAVGAMQIIPDTFARMADQGWNINDPVHNARAGLRYINRLYDLAGGDPALTAAGYYGGEGGLQKARQGVAVSDPRNPGAPNTLEYARQVVAGLGRAGDRAAAAVMPTANAAQPQEDSQWWAADPVSPSGGRVVVDQAPGIELKLMYGKDQLGDSPEQASSDASPQPQPQSQPQPESVSSNGFVGLGAGLGHGVGQVAMGLQHVVGKGAQLAGMDQAGQWLIDDAQRGRDRMDLEVAPYKDVSPFTTGTGEFIGNVAATLPVGGLLGKAAGAAVPYAGAAAPYVQKLAAALQSGGMSSAGPAGVGALARAADAGIRVAGGAMTGGASAGLVNPDDASAGAVIGGAFPMVAKGVGATAQATAKALLGNGATQRVKDLASIAKTKWGIDIPADRIVDSKPLNAAAASLNYIPFSGRSATESTMQSQLNKAVSRTVGQNTDNVTQALRDASADLGARFDSVLSANTIKVDNQFLNALANAEQRAGTELEAGQARIIKQQIDEILAKAQNGAIDGQAAYNIKKTLDRIGKQLTPQAFYANELKRDLMAALNRSLSGNDAKMFEKVREQYGNMLSLENLARNGADGDISIARLANMRNIHSPDLQELADIAAQFLKPREGQHGSMQRVLAGALAAGYGSPWLAGAGVMAGRGMNAALNSDFARSSVMGSPGASQALARALQTALPVSSKFLPLLGAPYLSTPALPDVTFGSK